MMTTRAQDTVFPGGVLGTFVPLDGSVGVVRNASGSKITMADGSQYIDCVMGSGPMIVGHAHPTVVAAIREQAELGTQYYVASQPALTLAEKIIAAVPCAERVKFTSSGAEATFQALRLARAYTGRSLVVRFRGAYHGHHDYGMLGSSAGIPAEVGSSVLTLEFNDVAGLERAFATHGKLISAVIVEPIQRNTPPAPGFLAAVVELAQTHGATSVFDEVVTGFRIAWGGAQELYDVRPDLATYGKIIGGGLPLAAVAGRAEILDLADPRIASSDPRYVYFSGTLNGNPLSAAAGVATLELLDQPGSYATLRASGAQLAAGIKAAADEHDEAVVVTCEGSLVGAAFTEGDVLVPQTLLGADRSMLRQLETELLAQGVFTNLAARIYLSLAHDYVDIAQTIEAFRVAFGRVAETRR
jgi:glutamate-1-semialdehyde 2,1-aminomutase